MDYDPLLLTDVSRQQNTTSISTHSDYSVLCSKLKSLTMVDPDSSCSEANEDFARENCYSPEVISTTKFRDAVANDVLDGRAVIGFSLTSPDLVMCAGSPDIPRTSCVESPEFLESRCHQKLDTSMELSFENGIDASQVKDTNRTPTVKFSTTLCQTYKEDLSPEASFELLPPMVIEDKSKEDPLLDVNNNVGSADGFLGSESPKDDGNAMCEGDYQKLLIGYENQRKELAEMRSAFEELKKQNQSKNNECREAWKSLKDLQNELMRKSMHVGSLAFAIEGQVKEKSKWFASLRDLTRKLKIMKMDHIKLSEEALAYKNCLADMNEMRSTIHSALNQQVSLHNDLKTKFIEGAKERKELYNKVLELKGNIRVFCRCRPLNTEEVSAGASMAIDFESEKEGELAVKSNGVTRRTFKFDAVFGPQADQADVFEDTAPFATSVLDGYNVCIFAYGQTGSGKTFTMEGTEEARGVNFRTLEQLFRIIKEREKLHRYDVSVSVLEVYNEQIRDLLVPGNQPGATAKRLEIRQAGEGTHHVPGLVEAHVKNMNEVWEVLQTGSNARAVGSTNANEHSSRSHCIHCVMVKGENLLNGECTRSKLWLVDLAGSERIAKTEVQGERLKETQNINRSLSALGDVISALATKTSHIPFRNSKLTHLLQDSLGGDSKTLMFLQISPNENDLSETLCSLNFASRVRGIELGPAKRQMDTSELLRYKQMYEKTKLDIKSKDVQIRKMEETVHGLELKIRERDLKNKCLQDKVKELESQLLIERKLARQHVDTKIAEQHLQQLKHQQDEQTTALARPPLTNRPLTTHKILNETAINTLGKDQVNPTQQLTEKANNKIPVPTMDGFVKYIDPIEKENNPDMAEQFVLPKRTGRASICPTVQRIPATSAPRRNSLIPLPTVPNRLQSPMPVLSLAPISAYHADKKAEMDYVSEIDCLPEQTPCSSPKVTRTGGKKFNSILRRSIQKKAQMKSPMPPHMRKGVNVGMEKVRVSIGSRGRMPHRVLLGNGRRAGTKEGQKQIREKERGWNIGTAGRNAI
ncbi:kinesin-like protein KIN-14Q [Rosa rugosa]|uniref:kinesin-like protein KIN-14Q n=1 Tax=Rosa rugosa TaxID=74645 RepID=UPI002B41743F|nr:kinesin-like protein KIN-14Q [Rosa rugosa]